MKEDKYEILREVRSQGITTAYSWVRHGACTVGFNVGTSGYCGGDASHGCVTEIRISDLGNTCMDSACDEDEVSIVFRGDDELDALIEGFEFVLAVLKTQKDGFKDCIAQEFERRLAE